MKSLAFILFVITVIGLIKPSIVLPFQKTKTRKRVVMYFGVTFIIVVIIASTQPQQTTSTLVTNETVQASEELGKKIFQEILVLEKEARIKSQAMFPVYGSELTRGSKFTLSEETHLMKELDPEDPAAAIHDLDKLPKGTIIEILLNLDGKRAWRIKVEGTNREGFLLQSALDHQQVQNPDEVQSNQAEAFYALKNKADSIIKSNYNLSQQQLDSLELVGIRKGWGN